MEEKGYLKERSFVPEAVGPFPSPPQARIRCLVAVILTIFGVIIFIILAEVLNYLPGVGSVDILYVNFRLV